MTNKPIDDLDELREAMSDLDPAPRLLMGPGPVNVDPRVLKVMASPLLGQFDPQFTRYMTDVMALYRRVFQTRNRWAFLIDGTARAAIEAAMASVIEPGDRVLVPVFGRFGQLFCEIASRCGAELSTVDAEWGTVFDPAQIEAAIKRHRPKVVGIVHGDTSTTMAQPLVDIARIAHDHDAIVIVDTTATLGGVSVPVDEWGLDCVTGGLQKCMSGPPGSGPITFNDRVEALIRKRRHVELGIQPPNYVAAPGARIGSNYFDLAMLMDYWSESRLNHHTEATSMLYAAREAARVVLLEGLEARFARHKLVGEGLCRGLTAMGLKLFGDQKYKMPNVTGVRIPEGVNADEARKQMLVDFGIEIGTAFGPLAGKIWRIGTMGYTARPENVMFCLAALETVLRSHGYRVPTGGGVDAAYAHFRAAAKPAAKR